MAHSLSTPQTASSVSPCFTGHGQSKLKKQGGSDIALPTCLPIIMADPLLQAVKSNFTLLQEVAANPLFPLSITIRGGGGEEILLLCRPCTPQQRGEPHSKGIHSISKSKVWPEGLNPQQDLNQKKNSLTFNARGESMESAVKEKHLCRYAERFCSESP